MKLNFKLITQDLINSSTSLSDLLSKIDYTSNSRTRSIIKLKLEKLNFDLTPLAYTPIRKYPLIKKICPICGTSFTTSKNHPREKQTCSKSCANTFFRSGENNPNRKSDEELLSLPSQTSHRIICFRYHEKKCIICNESNIVEVHHYDFDHTNNQPRNLVPLCPTHHKYIHSRYRQLIQKRLDEYVNSFK